MLDIGIENEYEIFTFLQKANEKVIVPDSDEVLKNPETILRKQCR